MKQQPTITRNASPNELLARLGDTRLALRSWEQQRLAGGLKNTAERHILKRRQARILTWLREQLAESLKTEEKK